MSDARTVQQSSSSETSVSTVSSEIEELRRRIRRDRKELRRQFRHHRQFLAIIATLFGLFVLAIGGFIGFMQNRDSSRIEQSFARERADLEKFQNEIKSQIIGNIEGAKLSLYWKDFEGIIKILDHQEIPVQVFKNKSNDGKSDEWVIQLYYIIKNDSDISSGQYFIKNIFQ